MELIDAPFWYWVGAGLVSLWQAFRGCRYYFLLGRDERFKGWRPCDRAVVLYVQATWLHFVCSAAGFVALAVAYRLTVRAIIGEFTAGEAGIIALASLFGFVGISGELPQLIQQGKFPGAK